MTKDLVAEIKKRTSETAKTSGLKGGIHKNIKIVDFRGPMEKFGDNQRYLTVKYKQFDDDGEPVGEFSASFMMLDAHSEYLDFKVKILLRQTYELAYAIYGDEWQEMYDPLKGIIEDEKDAKYPSIQSKLSSPKFVRKLENSVIEGVTTFMDKYMMSDKDIKFVLKLSVTEKGFVNVPSGTYIQNQENKLTLLLSDTEKSLIKKFK